MNRFAFLIFTATALVTSSSYAADHDGVMGNYRGDFTGAWADSHDIHAQVAGLSETNFKIVLFVSDGENPPARVEFEGRRKGVGIEDGKTIYGEVSFAEDVEFQGESVEVIGTIDKRKLEGSFGSGQFALRWKNVTSPTLGQEPPADAIVLMDGTNLDAWRLSPETWCLKEDGSAEICNSNMITKRADFGDALYHIEFKTSYMPHERGQARSNSGVYIMGRYEVQVLDSFGWEPAWDFCGGIYKVSVPKADAALPPLSWQTYDITFRAPRFDADGNKTEDAVINVLHNGIPVHVDLVLKDVTPGGISGEEAALGPLMFQHHNDKLWWQNVWVQPLADE